MPRKKVVKKKKNKNNILIEVLSGLGALLVVIIFLLFAPQSTYKTGYSTIDQLDALGKMHDEWIKMEGANILNPVYEKYYTDTFGTTFLSNIAGKFKWLWSWMPFSSKPLFSASYFKELLDVNNKIRQTKGYKGQFIQKINIEPETVVAVFGETQGGFHNLIRYLKKLRELGYIDNTFKISPKKYFLFQGNVVNRSPYTLEIFSILLKLIKENPDQVIYVRGEQEDYKNWSEQSLRRELELRAASLSSSKIPLENEVKTFFDSLPLVIYCTIPHMKQDKLPYFKMRAFTDDQSLIELTQDKNYASFLLESQKNSIDSYTELKKGDGDPQSDKIQLMAIIDGIKKRNEWEPMEGLRLLPRVDDVIRWYIFSSTYESIRALKYFHEAFGVITPGPKFEDWKITLYNRDVRNKDDLEIKKRDFHFFTGEEFGKEGQKPAEKAPAQKPPEVKPAEVKVPESKPAEKVAQKTTAVETITTKTVSQEIKPEVKPAEVKVPEQKLPEVKVSEQKPVDPSKRSAPQDETVKTPELKVPESKVAEKVAQKTTVAETTTKSVSQEIKPEVKPAEVKTPELKVPESKVAEPNAPVVKMPEQKLPEVKVPEQKTSEQKSAAVKISEQKVPEQKAPEKAAEKAPEKVPAVKVPA